MYPLLQNFGENTDHVMYMYSTTQTLKDTVSHFMDALILQNLTTYKTKMLYTMK